MKMSDNNRKTIVTTLSLATVLIAMILALILVSINYNEKTAKIPGGMTKELMDSDLYRDMKAEKSFCFIGDSITYGTETNGVQWYEPLVPYIKGNISNLSFGMWTVNDIISRSDQIPFSEVYVIALGTNDVLHPELEISAGTTEDYVKELQHLTGILLAISPDSKLYFISPWMYFDAGMNLKARYAQYRDALCEWCEETGHIFLDTEPILSSVFEKQDVYVYTLDGLHPNAKNGVGLYSYAVLKADHDRCNKSNN